MSFLLDWFYKALRALGLYGKSGRILLLGLDNAGKTTLLGTLKTGKVRTHIPTGQAQYNEVMVGDVKLRAHDLGGHKSARKLWKQYYATKVDGIIYMIDAAEPKRFYDSKAELHLLLAEDKLKNTPFLIMGNKVDKKGAVSESQLKEAFGLSKSVTGKGKAAVKKGKGVRPLEVFMCSIIRRAGYPEGIKWLAQYF